MPRSLPIHVATAALVLLSSIGTVWAQPGAPRGPTPVVVESVIEPTVTEDRSFVGTVRPSQTSVVGSAVDGRVENVDVDDGDWVTKGQTLAQLRIKTMDIEIQAAKAELRLREHELDELTEGARPEEKDQAKATLLRAEALRDFATSRLNRTLALPESAASTEELEQDRSAAAAAHQAWLEAQAAWELVELGPRQEKISQAKDRVAMQAVEVERLTDIRSKYTIMAPFDGYIVEKHAEVGQWLSRADPVVEMVAIDPIEVSVSIPEEHIAALKEGQAVTVHLEALHEYYDAKIYRVVPQADMRSRSFPVRIRWKNPRGENGHAIKAGMLARVAMAIGEPRPLPLVHKDAVVLGGDMPVVWAITIDRQTQGKIAVPVPVELGLSHGSYIRINGSLQVGQDVVVEGNERLRPGVPVQTTRRPQS